MSASDKVEIEFTKHAIDKFCVFQRHGLEISERFVAETVRNPELRDDEFRKPLKIAISELDNEHYLRVIYKRKGGVKKIITFFPVRKGRYESKI